MSYCHFRKLSLSLLNKSINFFKKNLDPKHLKGIVYSQTHQKGFWNVEADCACADCLWVNGMLPQSETPFTCSSTGVVHLSRGKTNKQYEWMNIALYCVLLFTQSALQSCGGISWTTTSVQHPLGWCDGCHKGASALTTHQLQVERRESHWANQVYGDY